MFIYSYMLKCYVSFINIILLIIETRQRGRFAGFSLQVSITENNASPSLCYKDGPKLPPLIFTTSCMYSGRYVTFFNERLDGVNYPWGYELNIFTELCEIVVEGNLLWQILYLLLYLLLIPKGVSKIYIIRYIHLAIERSYSDF